MIRDGPLQICMRSGYVCKFCFLPYMLSFDYGKTFAGYDIL